MGCQVARCGPQPMVEWVASARAAVEEAAGDPDMLDEALTIYEGLGGTRDIARVEAVLRSRGRRPSRRGWRQRQASVGWESLTRTELDVVSLAGEGLTNREVASRLYISPRTVETHMTHVFAKLGLSSRVDLRAEVARLRGDVPVSSGPPTAPAAGRASR